jgi:hypothetical protein
LWRHLQKKSPRSPIMQIWAYNGKIHYTYLGMETEFVSCRWQAPTTQFCIIRRPVYITVGCIFTVLSFCMPTVPNEAALQCGICTRNVTDLTKVTAIPSLSKYRTKQHDFPFIQILFKCKFVKHKTYVLSVLLVSFPLITNTRMHK